MNPMTNIKNVLKLSDQELRSNMKTSWHDQYKNSAWIFVGGLPYDLTEGDIICVFSQYGEIVNLNLVRDKGTGKSKGFCFVCYEDQRSTNLAVDNFNGIKLLNRTIRVDHCEDYKAPKDDKMDDDSRQLHAEGCAPGSKFGHAPQLPSSSSGVNEGLDKGLNLPPGEKLLKVKTVEEESVKKSKRKKEEKEKKTKDKVKKIFRKKKEKESSSSSSTDDSSSSDSDDPKSKKKKPLNLLKCKKEKSFTSFSDESETKNNRKEGSSNEKLGRVSQSHHKKSRKYSSSESEEERRPTSKRESNDENGSRRSCQPESRNSAKLYSGERSKDESSRGDGKDSFAFHRGHRDVENDRGDFPSGRGDKYRDSTRKFESERRDDRSKKYSREGYREDSGRHDGERKRRDDRGEDEYYRRKESGGRY